MTEIKNFNDMLSMKYFRDKNTYAKTDNFKIYLI